MPSDDLVSVVVPAYNHAPYVADSLRSIAAQTYPRLELLVIDDGSSDGTNAVIAETLAVVGPRFERVVHVSRPNRGVVATLNELTDLARGDYLFRLASDDVAKPDAVATLHRFLARHRRYALAVGDNELIDERGVRVFWDAERNNVPEGRDVRYRTFGEFLRHVRPDVDFDSRDFGAPHTLAWAGNYLPNGRMHRTSAVREVGGHRPGTLDDWYMNFRLASRYRLKYIDTVLVSYRWHETNSIKDRGRISRLEEETRRVLEPEWRTLRFRVRAKARRTWTSVRRSIVATVGSHANAAAPRDR